MKKQMAVRQEPPWTDDLDLTWRERGKMLAGAFLGLVWVLLVLTAIFIAGASPTP